MTPAGTKFGKSACKIGNKRITVDGLEQVLTMVANVAGFNGSFLGEFTLKAKAPGMDLVRPKVRVTCWSH